MRLLICAGGTGGGVYPALAVLRALQNGDSRIEAEHLEIDRSEPLEVLWVGGAGGIELELLEREDIPFTTIPAAGVHGVGISALPGNLWQILKGVFAARSIIARFQPQAMFFTGGYLAVPVALAGRLPGLGGLRPKNLLYVPDIEPGIALKVLARLADMIALTSEESMAFFPDQTKLIVTGYPTRRELKNWSLQNARVALGLSPELPTLLVFGGSKGSRSINHAILNCLPQLLDRMQLIHISGHLDWEVVERFRRNLSKDIIQRYHAYPYLHEEMGAALSAADLVVSRAGASILGEFPLFGIPAILVPYPYAWRYQEVNAHYLASRGAAIVIPDEDLSSRLEPAIYELIEDRSRREGMLRAMQSLARPNAAMAIGDLVLGMVHPIAGERT